MDMDEMEGAARTNTRTTTLSRKFFTVSSKKRGIHRIDEIMSEAYKVDPMGRARVLLVSNESAMRAGLRAFLERRGLQEIREAETVRGAVDLASRFTPEIVIFDGALCGEVGDSQTRLRRAAPAASWILLSTTQEEHAAIGATRDPSTHVLTKPIELDTLHRVMESLLHCAPPPERIPVTTERGSRSIDPFLGRSAAIAELASMAKRALQTSCPILILGETGTGKGVLASWLHSNGPRAQKPFVDLNCAGLSREFLESELFGFERGAYTGAVSAKPGMFEVAHGGTVFLDEIGDVDPLVQPKLLKVLEEKRFHRMGEVKDRCVDIRLIAATHRHMLELVREGRFRSDLYFRVSTIPLRVPSLRERTEDILVLAAHFLKVLAKGAPCAPRLSEAAERKLCAYSWPGNIRELKNILERAMILSRNEVIEVDDLRFDAVADVSTGTDSNMTLAQLERYYIEKILNEENGKVISAAQRLGIPRSSLYQKIKVLGISLPRSRDS